MPTFTVDPVTGIVIPTPGQEPGEQYAVDVSNALLTLAHLTHTGAAHLDGYQIPSAGINFNADISAQSNNLTNLRSTRYTDQSSVLVGIGDVDCLYFKSGDLWINDGAGTPVQITSGAVINVTSSNNYNSKSISANYTINPSDGYVVFNADPNSNTILLTLPLAGSVPVGRFYLVKDVTGHAATHNISIQKAGSDTIDHSSSAKLIDFNFGAIGFISDGVSNWSAWSYDRLVYHSGETVILQSGATLNLQAGSVFTMAGTETMPSGSTLTIQSGANFNVNNGAASAINLSSGSTLTGKSGSTLEMQGGSTFITDDTCLVEETLHTNSYISLLGNAQITGTSNTIIATDGYMEIQSGGLLQVQVGGTLDVPGVITLEGSLTSAPGSTITANGIVTCNTTTRLLGATELGGGTTATAGVTLQGTTLTVDGTSTITMLSGSILSASTGSTAQLSTVNISDMQKFRGNTKTITSNYTIDTGVGNDYILLCDPTGGAFTITVPLASVANKGRIVILKNPTSSTNNVAITRSGSDTIDGVVTVGTGIAYFSVVLMCSGTNWYSIGGVGIAA